MGQEGVKFAVRGGGVAVWPGPGLAELGFCWVAVGRCQRGPGQGGFGGSQRL